MPKFGTAVQYEGDAEQKHLAFIISTGENKTNADLLVLTAHGNAEYEGVARRDEGGGHTWKPAS